MSRPSPGALGPSARGPRAGGSKIRGSGYVFTLTGTIEAGSGAPIAGATVDLFVEDANRTFVGTTTTDSNGIYTFHPPTNACTYRAVAAYTAVSPPLYGSAGGLVAV